MSDYPAKPAPPSQDPKERLLRALASEMTEARRSAYAIQGMVTLIATMDPERMHDLRIAADAIVAKLADLEEAWSRAI